jgi:hypothetical protein
MRMIKVSDLLYFYKLGLQRFLMKRICFSFLFSTLQYLSGQALLSFEAETLLLGKIPEGPSFEILFHFKNIGKSPLIISNVQSSCGCVVVSWPSKPIMPQENGTIVAHFLSKGRIGYFHKNITVHSNDSTHVLMPLFFKGEIVAGMNLQNLVFIGAHTTDTLHSTSDQRLKIMRPSKHTHGFLLEVHNNDSLPAYLQLNDYESNLQTFWTIKPKGPRTQNQLTTNWNRYYFKNIILQPHSKARLYYMEDHRTLSDHSLRLVVNEDAFEIQIKAKNK